MVVWGLTAEIKNKAVGVNAHSMAGTSAGRKVGTE